MHEYARLSSPIEGIGDHYTVVVVGSGYGGGIAASRMARAGQTVCLLERGKERQPGELPKTADQAVAEMQADAGERGSRHEGLYDMRSYDDISVLVGSGLGGTSLINASVSIEADPRVFDDPRWPKAIRDDLADGLAHGYRRAREMLKPAKLPDAVHLAKASALETAASALKARWGRAELNVTFESPEDGFTNHVGVRQYKCIHCGDCITGCNEGAKNTTIMNYVPDAVNHSADVFTDVEVRRVARDSDGKYRVYFQIRDVGRQMFDSPDQSITGDVVILAAGTLGSTEILLRSRREGLSTSNCVGSGFTGNGDVLGFAYNSSDAIRGVGWGAKAKAHADDVKDRTAVGPSITTFVDLRDPKQDVNHGLLIEEGAMPGPLATFMPAPLAAAARILGKEKPRTWTERFSAKVRELKSIICGPHRGAMNNTLTYLVMGHESDTGRMELVDDRLALRWPKVGDQPVFEKINDRLIAATDALGGIFVRNPLWTAELKHHLVTVHPLGGCVMADTAASGVVNHKGQVFAAGDGTNVHAGLYVSDGSIIPRSLGCNPLLTISALSERVCALIAKERGWTIDYTLPSVPAPRQDRRGVGVEFTERMVGHVSKKVSADYEAAEKNGQQHGSSLEIVLTICIEDLDRLVEETYESKITGTCVAPALSAQPMTVSDGSFVLLATDPFRHGGKNMRYRMKLSSTEGKQYWFQGTKYIEPDGIEKAWDACTTLYVDISANAEAAPIARGIIRVQRDDFIKQLQATHAVNARGTIGQLKAVGRFAKYFVGELWDVYGSRPKA